MIILFIWIKPFIEDQMHFCAVKCKENEGVNSERKKTVYEPTCLFVLFKIMLDPFASTLAWVCNSLAVC